MKDVCPPGGANTREVGRPVITCAPFMLLPDAKALAETGASFFTVATGSLVAGEDVSFFVVSTGGFDTSSFFARGSSFLGAVRVRFKEQRH